MSSTPVVVPGAAPAVAKARVGGYIYIYIYIYIHNIEDRYWVSSMSSQIQMSRFRPTDFTSGAALDFWPHSEVINRHHLLVSAEMRPAERFCEREEVGTASFLRNPSGLCGLIWLLWLICF